MTEFNPSQLARTDTERLTSYRQNLDFYNGSQWQTTSRNRQLVFNYAKVSIDKVTSFLMQGLTFACYPLKADSSQLTAARSAEQLLRQVYEDNNLRQLDWETEIDAAVLGDGCYKVIWDAGEKRIRITAPDISGIFAWWLGDDLAKLWRVASRYTLTQDEINLLYGRDITKKQASITEVWTDKTFDLFLDNDLIDFSWITTPSSPSPTPMDLFPSLYSPTSVSPRSSGAHRISPTSSSLRGSLTGR